MDSTMQRIATLRTQGHLRDIDYYLAASLTRRHGETDPVVFMSAALASRLVGDGHACLDLRRLAGRAWPDLRAMEVAGRSKDLRTVRLPDLDAWREALESSTLCGDPAEREKPLVLVANGQDVRLYLRRYYHFEEAVAARLKQLAGRRDPVPGRTSARQLARLFPDAEDGSHVEKRAAAAAALERRLLIISGGPGTGKTYMLARLLALLLGRDGDGTPDIRLAAPTGKAAMRMAESIREAGRAMRMGEEVAAQAGEKVSTLHRLLRTTPGTPHFRHDADHPLPADIVIVDEASMVALPLMARLLAALKPEARLILLGDRHQLASVEPGSVLGDICAAARKSHGAPLHGTLVELTHSKRFPSQGPIGRLSAALPEAGSTRDPDGAGAWRVLQQGARDGEHVVWHDMPPGLRGRNGRPIKDLRRLILIHYRAFLETATAEKAFEALKQFRILCATRSGPHGVQSLNALTEDILSLKDMTFTSATQALRPARALDPTARFYDHRVIMVTRNDYTRGLFNGDIGIILPEPAGHGPRSGTSPQRLAAWFEQTDPDTGAISFRKLPCPVLPEHETAFAMTIHKAQGSQFNKVLVMLPPGDHPVLTRELVYTAMTRASRQVLLWCARESFQKAVQRRTRRASGLCEALSCNPDPTPGTRKVRARS